MRTGARLSVSRLARLFTCGLGPALTLVVVSGVAGCVGAPPPPPLPPPTVAIPDTSIPLASSEPSGPMSASVVGPNLTAPPHVGRFADQIDPFRWLEDGESAETRAFTERENARTRQVIDAIPGRAAFRADIERFLQVGTLGAPAVRRAKAGVLRYFHTKREGAQNQSTLYVRDGLRGRDRVLLDVSALSADGTSALDWWFPSRDGAWVAWGRSESGSEESVLHLRDVETGRDHELRIDRTRHASVAWKPDGSGFYYSRYPKKGTVPSGDEKYGAKIFYHDLASRDPDADPVVFAASVKTDVPSVSISPNGKWLAFHVHQGWDKNELYLQDATTPGAPRVPLAVGKKALFSAALRDEGLFIHTNDGAPKYELYAADYAHPERAAWRKVLAEAKEPLEDVAITKQEIVATYLVDAATKVVRFGHDGTKKAEVRLPEASTAHVSAGLDGEELFVRDESFARPSRVQVLDARGGLQPWDKVGATFSAGDVQVKRLFATSKDGTQIPLFVISKGPLRSRGSSGARGASGAATVLYGYGGFNVNQRPAYSARVMSVLSRGGVWAHAVLRGGGEYGEAWHEAGMLAKKQNVFDDFYACAEKLVAEGITSREKLAAMGGSNGGLLVATALTQRPELFRVGLSLVPLTDMLRYHLFRIAKLWIPEYGDPEAAAAREWLYAYSPYHHVTKGTRYPAALFTTAESDSRVDPMHARKMAARLAAAQSDATRPVLLRVEAKAGHGAGKPVGKLAEEMADELGFMLNELGQKL
ncbi:MAG TPA: prolyl oligopeptidase family serine peptidase [Polyangiaceae bacterium]|nr:prolyl oligopeptidase family serine peptidase [Polyangiaceae bacterium]